MRLLFLLLITLRIQAAQLTLQNYLEQVNSKNEGLQSLKLSSEASKDKIKEGELLTTYSLFANALVSSDAKPTIAPTFQGTKTVYDAYSLGISKAYSFGLSAKLSYNITYTDIRNAPLVATPRFYDGRPTLELNQSLWKNGFGSETSATLKLLEAQSLASHYLDAFKTKATLAEAEMVYWKYVLSKEMVQIQEQSLDRAKKLKEWNVKRAKLSLADRADSLSADAGLQYRGFEYQIALDELRSAGSQFNSFRGIDNDTVSDELEAVKSEQLLSLVGTEKKSHREDVLAAEAYQKVAEASAELGKDKNKPTLDLFGAVSLNGRRDAIGNVVGESFNTDKPTISIGLKFLTPLDFGLVSDNLRAHSKEKMAAELQFKRKLFEEAQNWKDLNQKLKESKKRLELAHSIEEAQKLKLNYEKDRLKRGRTVTYQVLLYEQDYATSQMSRIKTEAEILSLVAQLKTYKETEKKP